MSNVPKYRKLPVEITAIRWTGEWAPIRDWLLDVTDGNVPGLRNPDGSLDLDGRPIIRIGPDTDVLLVDTLEGMMRAERGDWIICGVKGEFYPCKNEIFEATYEAVE